MRKLKSPDNLRILLPADTSVEETREQSPLESLFDEERLAIVSSVPKRAAEYATGRWCARQALARIGIHDFPLLRNSDRAPLWPSDIVGSITHTEGYCAAVVARRKQFLGIGIDVEIDKRVGAELWPTLFTSDEIGWLEQVPELQRESMATVLFGAKESFYKAQYSFTKDWLEFHAATVSVTGDSWKLELLNPQGILARLRMPACGRFIIRDQFVFTAVAIESFQVNPN